MDRLDTIEAVKKVLRPIVKYRFLVERAKFLGAEILSPTQGNARIGEMLHSPGVVGKIGGTEIKLARQYLRKKNADGVCLDFGKYRKLASVFSGIYPDDVVTLSKFSHFYLETLRELDLLALWFNFGEARARRDFANKAILTYFHALGPFRHERPWTSQLVGKRVVVVSPFVKTITSQYKRREEVWARNPAMMPEFDLEVLRCPQLVGLTGSPEYPDWFAALDALKAQLSARKFDVAIVGAGAWSLPLAVHAKSLGAFGIHMGGETQLLFGIRGKRWDNHPVISPFYNDAWVRPDAEERPAAFRKTENGCYW